MSGLPKSLLDAQGEPKRPPAKLRALFECPACGASLERTSRYWVCPTDLGHTKLVSDQVLLAKLKKAMRGRYRRWTAIGILRIQLRVRRRLGVRLKRERERERARSLF